MLPVPNLIVITSFIILGIGFLLAALKLVKSEESLWGNPSVHPLLFYAGKISMFLCWALMLLDAIFPSMIIIHTPSWMPWTGSLSFCAGVVVLLVSFHNLGNSLKYGLPESGTLLKTTGLYRISRHPLYMGVFLTLISAVIFFPNILIILLAGVCIGAHYPMILAEERFLAERFGQEWESYKNRVRRFL